MSGEGFKSSPWLTGTPAGVWMEGEGGTPGVGGKLSWTRGMGSGGERQWTAAGESGPGAVIGSQQLTPSSWSCCKQVAGDKCFTFTCHNCLLCCQKRERGAEIYTPAAVCLHTMTSVGGWRREVAGTDPCPLGPPQSKPCCHSRRQQ